MSRSILHGSADVSIDRAASVSFQAKCLVATDHPAIAGHFPGLPVVPGVVILDEVRRLCVSRWPDRALSALPEAKFVQPLLPNQEFVIQVDELAPGDVRFQCLRAGELCAKGRMRFIVRGVVDA